LRLVVAPGCHVDVRHAAQGLHQAESIVTETRLAEREGAPEVRDRVVEAPLLAVDVAEEAQGLGLDPGVAADAMAGGLGEAEVLAGARGLIARFGADQI